MPIGRCLDFTLIAQAMPRAEVQLIGERTSAITGGVSFGPMAIVVASNAIAGSVRTYEQATALKRPFQIFRDFPSARAWLDKWRPQIKSRRWMKADLPEDGAFAGTMATIRPMPR